MDDDTDNLIAQLCTRMGMIMEDASPVAIGIGAMDHAQRRTALTDLSDAAAQIAAISKAVEALGG